MHLLRTAPLIAATLACLAVPATTASATTAAATTLPHHAQAAAGVHIVIYKGNGEGSAGPAGALTSSWVADTAPEKIVTNDGDIVDSTALNKPWGTCAKDCGERWYKTRTNAVELNSFYWEKGGTKTEEHALVNISNNNGWFTLANGDLTPRCLVFSGAAFQLTKPGGDWKKTSSPCTTKP